MKPKLHDIIFKIGKALCCPYFKMTLLLKKQIFWVLKTLLVFLLGGAVTFFFQEPVKRLIYESPPALEYQVLSSQHVDKSELIELLYSSFKTTKVDFPMDDNVVSGYYYTVVELRNKGNFIKDDLLLDLDFMNEKVKILCVLSKMIEPQERQLKAEIDRPPLELQLPAEDIDRPEVTLCWESTQRAGEGAIVYRSYSEHAGFGRRNPIPIVGNSFSEKRRKGSSYYYGATNLNFIGESELTEVVFVPVPEVFFNRPNFKETINIRQPNLCDEMDPITLRSSFNKATAKRKSDVKIFVDMDRKEFGRIISENVNDLPVYFKDDVKFLHGKTTLRLNNIMRKAKIRFYIISKTYLKYDNRNLILSLRDIKNIELKKIQTTPKETKKQYNEPTAKELLTPHQVKLFTAKDRVVLAWVKPRNQTYRGVRIFRSLYSEPHTELVWGKELYDGKGIQGIVINAEGEVSGVSIGVVSSTDSLNPPPRKVPRRRDPSTPLPPAAPTGLRMTGTFLSILNGYKGELMPFYEDQEVIFGKSYVYTIVAYDNNDQYSYPIEALIKYEPMSNQPIVNSFSEYQKNLELLQTLKQFYLNNKNTVKANQIESIIRTLK